MTKSLFDELAARFSDALSRSPARDVEQNARALLNSLLQRMEVARLEEIEALRSALATAMTRVEALEARVLELETRQQVQTPQSPAP